MSRSTEAHVASSAAVVSRRHRLIVNGAMLLALAYFLLPLVWVLIASTKSNRDLFGTFSLWFGGSFQLFTNIGDLFSKDDGIYLRWLLNTAVYTTVSAFGAALFSAMAGFALSKYRFRGRSLIMAITIGAIMVPPQILVLPTFLLLSRVGMTGTAASVILPMMVSPIGVFLMKTYADAAVPDELLDAAKVDGSGDLRAFWTIALRLMAPGFVTVFLLVFVANWNNYFLPLVMLSDDTMYPVTVGLTNWITLGGLGQQVSYSIVVTGALFAILPVILVFVSLQRFWQGGLTMGSGK